MSEDTDFETTDAMIYTGGAFVRDLGRLFRRADCTNQAKLKAAFPEYFTKYRAIAKARAATEEKAP